MLFLQPGHLFILEFLAGFLPLMYLRNFIYGTFCLLAFITFLSLCIYIYPSRAYDPVDLVCLTMTFVEKQLVILLLSATVPGWLPFFQVLPLSNVLLSEIDLFYASSVISLNILSAVCNDFILLLCFSFFCQTPFLLKRLFQHKKQGLYFFLLIFLPSILSRLQCSSTTKFQVGPVYYSGPSQVLYLLHQFSFSVKRVLINTCFCEELPTLVPTYLLHF